jgi:hypothetical protein
MWNRALILGLRNSKSLKLMLPLYLAGLLIGLFQLWPLAWLLDQQLSRSPFLDRLVLSELSSFINFVLGSPDQMLVGSIFSIWLLISLFLPIVFGVFYNVLSGGMLSASNGMLPFWAGCLRYFWSFNALGIILLVAALIVMGTATVLANLFNSLNFVILICGLVLLQLLNLLGEYARAIAIVRQRRNPFVLFGAALVFCARRLPGALVFGSFGLLLNIALAAFYWYGSQAISQPILLIVFQQICLFAWVWIKFLRLLWALFYVQNVEVARNSPQNEPFGAIQSETPISSVI